MTVHYSIVRALIAARNYQRALTVARHRGLQMGQWRLLSYETHVAFPDVDLHVDPSWTDHRDPAMIEALVARRLTKASGRRLGPGSRAVIARDGI